MVGDRVPGVLPALVLEAGLLVAALVGDVAVALQVGVLVDPVQGGARLRLERRARAWCRRSSARTRRAARRRAAWRRRSRSRASAAAPRRPSSRRSASRAGCGPGPRRGSRRPARPARCPSAMSVRRGELGGERQRLQAGEDAVAAEHGHEPRQAGRRQAVARQRSAARSAARRGRPGCAGRCVLSGSQSHSRRGASASHFSRLRSMSGLRLLGVALVLGRVHAHAGAERSP